MLGTTHYFDLDPDLVDVAEESPDSNLTWILQNLAPNLRQTGESNKS